MLNEKHLCKIVYTYVSVMLVFLFCLSTGLGSFSPASAKESERLSPDPANLPASSSVVSSDQLLELGVPKADSLRLEGEQLMRFGDYDRAIAVLQRAVEMTPTDMDGRLLYAEALEKKLIKQKNKEASLYNFLIKQWLVVSKKSNYLDQQMQGRSHLSSLTGTAPAKFESNKHFLARVLVPEDGSVRVMIGGRQIASK